MEAIGSSDALLRWGDGSSGAEDFQLSFVTALTSLLRCHAPMAVGPSGDEGSAAAPLTCSLYESPVLSPMVIIGIVGLSGGTVISN